MRLLLYGSFYSPELTGIGKYTGEMARWLAARGHEVKVVSAPPHFPDWKVPEGYSSWRWSRRIEGGVTVWRCPAWIPSAPGGLTRLLHLASFVASSLPILLVQLTWRPDIVWVVEPPLMCAPTAAVVSRLTGAVSWLHIQDLEVDAAFNMGWIKGRTAKSIALRMEQWLMRRFDVVSTISGKMLERLRSKGIAASSIVSLPNWADIDMFDGVTPGAIKAMRQRLGIPDQTQVVLYSGNMSRKQGLEILAKVAADSRVSESSGAGLTFVFCGNGIARADLEDACRGFANVRFSDLMSAADFPVLLRLADIHLLPQLPQASDLVMPSKLTGILASERPVVATAAPDTELSRVASIGGLVVEPGNDDAMVQAILQLASDNALREKLGQAGRAYAVAHLDKENVLTAFERDLARLRPQAKASASG